MTSDPEDRDVLDPESARAKDKRPRALIDLEATEVTAPSDAPEDSREAGRGVGDARAAEPTPAAAAPGAPNDDHDTEIEDARPAEDAGGSRTPSAAWPLTGVMTHVAAGLVGGALALLLFTAFAPQFAKRGAVVQGSIDLATMELRLDAVERANVAATGVEGRVMKAEQAQARLSDDLRVLADKLGNQDLGALTSRVAKIEEQVAGLAAPAPAGSPQTSARQLSALTSKIADIEARLSKPGESGGEALKSEVARLDQSIAAVKSQADQNAEAARAAQEATNALRSGVDALSAKVDQQFQATAKSGDIPAAITPLSARLTALEQGLDGIATTEATRRDAAGRILLSLELATLKRAVERGERYDRELAEVRKTSAGKLDLAALDAWSERGAPTLADLSREFHALAPSLLDAGRDGRAGSVFDRLVAGARSVVRVRKLDHDASDTSAEAIVSRVGSALADGRLGDAIGEANKLPAPARSILRPWLEQAEARHAVDAALAAVEGQLKASLTEADANPPPPH